MKKFVILLLLVVLTAPVFAGYAKGDGEFVNSWLLLGTFDNANFNKEYVDPTIRPYDGMESAGKTWGYFDDRYFSRNYDDYTDLFSYYRYKLKVDITCKCAYLFTYIYSDTDQTAEIRGDGDGIFRVYFNGERVIEYPNHLDEADNDGISPQGLHTIYTFKDINKAQISLKKGFNTVLVKVGNKETAYLGCYLRICDENGNKVPGIRYTTSENEKINILTKTPKGLTNELPIGYISWPYVEFYQPYYEIMDWDKMISQNPAIALENKNLCTSADAFCFNASGVGNITFKISKGKLPKGLTLESDGKIKGRIDSSVKPGTFKFTVTVTDQKGQKNSKSFSMTVKDKPTKYIRDGRLTALIHAPEMLEGEQIEELARLMKRQNYTLAMPISYGNGDHTFRWPSCFEPNAENKDVIPAYKKALEENGVGFGMYIGEVIGCPQFHYQQTVLMLEDAMKQLNPKAFWFDWAGQWRPQNDQLFSALKTYNPDIVLFLNAFGTFFNGDYDMACIEDFSYGNNKTIWYWWPYERFYNDYTFNYENPKTNPIEVWKIIINPKNHPDGVGADLFNNEELQPWKELQQLEISLIGDGAVFNFDHSPAVGFNANAMKGKDLYYSPVMEIHKKLADWQNPEGLTPLYTSFTQVNPYKLDNTDWGYSLLSSDCNKIYLHFMENRRGKKGLAYFGENDISVSPIDVPVKSVVCMNNGKSVKFSKKGNTLNIDKSGLVQDEIDTILCINLGKKINYAEPMSIYPLTSFEPHSEQDIFMTDVKEGKPGDLAYGKPSKLLAPDCKKECPPSAYTSYAKNAVDNDPKTGAQAAWSWAWVLETDLEKVCDVKRIDLTFAENCFATDFNIEVSEDRENWKKIVEIADNEKKNFTFDVTERFRYIRVRAIKPDDAGQKGLQMGITSLEIF